MDKISCIYIIRSKVKPHMFYVGSTKDFHKRKSVYLCVLKRGNYTNRILQHHYNKYGKDDLQFEVHELVPDNSKLLIREQHYLDTLKPNMNILKRADSCAGVVRTEEYKERISKSLKKWYSKNGPPNKGIKRSIETRKKLSAARIGKFNGEFHHQFGKQRTADVKAKISAALTGRKMTDEQKAKLKNRPIRSGADSPNGVKVVNIRTNEKYDTIRMAAKATGIPYNYLWFRLKGKTFNNTDLKIA